MPATPMDALDAWLDAPAARSLFWSLALLLFALFADLLTRFGDALPAVGAPLRVVAILIERSPALLLSGLGAMTAMLLVFKDTIGSLVASVQLAGKVSVNIRRVTDIGAFRAYVETYLRAHPRIHRHMTPLVRQPDPGANGLPPEIYCFTATSDRNECGSIQGDIFHHLCAIADRFGLRLFQSPGSGDLRPLLAHTLVRPGWSMERGVPST